MASKLTATSKPTTVVKNWVKALRSGKYKQGTMQLKHGRGSNAKYCCLGVLCDLAVQAKVISKFTGTNGFPSEKVAEWAGLRTQGGMYAGGDSLVNQNDNTKKTFADIADLIESKPDGLFASKLAV